VIPPERLLAVIRQELATRVLPELSDDRARSSVIAMMGILGDIAPHVRAEEAWAGLAAEELAQAVARWRAELPELADVLAVESTPDDPAGWRHALLAAIENAIPVLWQQDPARLPAVRAVLRADLEHQLKQE
jgi:hypothetical protein